MKFACLVLLLGTVACTVEIDVPAPKVTIECVEVILPGGGQPKTFNCPEAGAVVQDSGLDATE